MLALVAPSAWAFDAGHTNEPMLAATATDATAETIPIMRLGENRMTGCRVGGCWVAGGSVDRCKRVTDGHTPRRNEKFAHCH